MKHLHCLSAHQTFQTEQRLLFMASENPNPSPASRTEKNPVRPLSPELKAQLETRKEFMDRRYDDQKNPCYEVKNQTEKSSVELRDVFDSKFLKIVEKLGGETHYATRNKDNGDYFYADKPDQKVGVENGDRIYLSNETGSSQWASQVAKELFEGAMASSERKMKLDERPQGEAPDKGVDFSRSKKIEKNREDYSQLINGREYHIDFDGDKNAENRIRLKDLFQNPVLMVQVKGQEPRFAEKVGDNYHFVDKNRERVVIHSGDIVVTDGNHGLTQEEVTEYQKIIQDRDNAENARMLAWEKLIHNNPSAEAKLAFNAAFNSKTRDQINKIITSNWANEKFDPTRPDHWQRVHDLLLDGSNRATFSKEYAALNQDLSMKLLADQDLIAPLTPLAPLTPEETTPPPKKSPSEGLASK
jgi:hypothetical protein